MNVAMGGSRKLALDAGFAKQILRHMSQLPAHTKILLRRGVSTEPNAIEQLIADLCPTLGIDFEWCVPDSPGREGVFLRDVTMIERADALVVYFHPDHIMEGGTGHLVEKAMDRDTPTWAYTFSDEHGLERVGDISAAPGTPADVLTRTLV
jgi:hypothetical protein